MKAKENPFRVERLHELPYLFPEGDSFAQFFTRVEANHFRGALVGPHGAGKTTLLLELLDELDRRNIEYRHLQLRDESGFNKGRQLADWISTAPSSAVLVLDSAGLLNWWDWQLLRFRCRSFAGLIVTLHRERNVPTLVRCRPSVAVLKDLVERLSPDSSWSESMLQDRFAQHGGNLRDCLRSFYDDFSAQ